MVTGTVVAPAMGLAWADVSIGLDSNELVCAPAAGVAPAAEATRVCLAGNDAGALKLLFLVGFQPADQNNRIKTVVW